MASKASSLWTSDWFAGLCFTALFVLGAYTLAPRFFHGLESAAYDRALRMSQLQPSPHVALVEIDDRSVRSIGAWPWPRDIHAAVIDELSRGGARVIATQIEFSEPRHDPGVGEIEALAEFFAMSGLDTAAADDGATGAALAELYDRMQQSLVALDKDRVLAESVAEAGNVLLPVAVVAGNPLGRAPEPAPPYVARDALAADPAQLSHLQPPRGVRMLAPIAPVGDRALGTGVLLPPPLDSDGAVRAVPLAVDYYGTYLPSLALATVAHALRVDPADVEIRDDGAVVLGDLAFAANADLTVFNNYYSRRGTRPPFPTDSFYEVWTGLVPVDKFRDKIVLIGATAAGIGNAYRTPVAEDEPGLHLLAHSVSSLLQRDFYTRPDWAPATELAILLLLAAYVCLMLPRLPAGTGVIVSVGIVLALLTAEFTMLLGEGVWLRLISACAFVVGGHVLMTVKRLRLAENLRLSSEADSAESNKMLALAFQSQGQLDMAFEKFRRCPLDDALMDLLYNLGLDYERKRQFNKAAAVYSYMMPHDPRYRDLAERVKRSQALDETVILGAAGASAKPGLVAPEWDGEKPMLGRYVVEKELGKGAMGTVYLGRDPKINRVVAIKTIPLSAEFDEDELEAAKERFFREAESAGRLNHPDIVTVYDAGEDHDLAYIAMEFLKGDHLNRHTRPPKLLPVAKTLDVIARTADALDYAHKEGVVHRDIKPANIMYDVETDEVKITDFGVARITDASKTKTGIVLGTPSYMSPEQLAGKNVTGRSDLFSLGVTLFQLLSGQLPFRADSMATLMYKIANEPHIPLRVVRPDLPNSLEDVISKALQKEPELRHASGAAMAVELRQCIEKPAA